jgi:hypothetical protein
MAWTPCALLRSFKLQRSKFLILASGYSARQNIEAKRACVNDALTTGGNVMKSKDALLTACGVVAMAGLVSMFSASGAEIQKSQSTKMDEPMAGEMKKKGMKQGEVRKHEEKWDRKMKEMIRKEENTMTQSSAKK